MNRIRKFFSNEDGLRDSRLVALGAVILITVVEIVLIYYILAGK